MSAQLDLQLAPTRTQGIDLPVPARVAAVAGLALAVAKTAVIVGLLVVIGAYASVLVPSLQGKQTLIVFGGSMEPTIPVGSIIVLDSVPSDQLKVGDVITFTRATKPDLQITHRILSIEKTPAGLAFQTKGDANPQPDAWVVEGTQAVGRVSYHVPFVGQVLLLVSSTAAKLAICGALLAALAVGAVRRRGSAE